MDSPVGREKAMFTAHSLRSFETLSAQRTLGFSCTVERTVHESHPKLRFIGFVSQITTLSIESMIRWVPAMVASVITLPEGLGFISFRPPPPCGMRCLFLRGQRKEIRKIPLRTLRLKRSGRLTFKDLNKAWA